jgi:hypothetical protein
MHYDKTSPTKLIDNPLILVVRMKVDFFLLVPFEHLQIHVCVIRDKAKIPQIVQTNLISNKEKNTNEICRQNQN